MKSKYIFIIFLFILLAGSLYSQNQYERWNGVFEGANTLRAFRFIVEQEAIDGNGSLSNPIFRFFEAPGLSEFGEKFYTLSPSDERYTENGAMFELWHKNASRILYVEFRKGEEPKDDIYLLSNWFGDGETVITLKRKN